MTTDTRDQLRALLLASLMALSIVAGSVALAGSAAASDFDDLQAGDGAGGEESRLIEGFDDQLPTGIESENDTLRVEAEDGTLPEFFRGELRLGNGDVSINTSQSKDDVELVVYGEGQTQASASDDEDISVEVLEGDRLEFQVYYDEETPVTGEREAPVAVEISNLTFDAGGTEKASLTWEIDNEEAVHTLNVTEFDPGLQAFDGDRSVSALLTAGQQDQPMVGPQGSSTLVLDGDEDELPQQFQVTASLPDEGISFHEGLDASNVTAESDYGDVTVRNVTTSEIDLTVTDFDPDANGGSLLSDDDGDVLRLDGVTFDVADGADQADVTWEVRGASDTFGLRAEYLTAEFAQASYEIPRGASERPTDGVELTVAAEGVYTDGFHAYDVPMYIEIPAEQRDELSFDRSAEPSVPLGDSASATVEDENTIRIEFDQPPWETWEDGDSVTVSDVRFNTSGASELAGDELTLESGLDVRYAPEDALSGFVDVPTKTESVVADVPDVSFDDDVPTEVNVDSAGHVGSSPLVVNVTDTTGGQIQPGTEVVVAIDGAEGLRFDESQDVWTDGTVGFSAGTIERVGPREIVVEVPEAAPEPSHEGEYLLISGPDGQGIRFDTTDANVNDTANLTVRTSAGSAPVTQRTGTAVSVVDGNEMSAEPTRIPAGGGDVNVTIVDADGDGISGVDVEPSIDDLDPVTTDENGNATFEDVALENAENETITFTATVEGRELTTHVTSVAPRISAEPEAVLVGNETTVTVTLERYEVDEGYVADDSTVEATADPYDDSVVQEIGSDADAGTTTFDVDLTDEEDNGTITFDSTVNGTDVSTTVVAASEGDVESEEDTLALGESHDVGVTVYDIDGEPQDDVTVTAKNEEMDIESTATTDSSGHAELGIDLRDVETPGTISLEADLDEDATAPTATGSIETAVMRTPDPGTVPVDRETNVTVEIDASSGTDVEGLTVSTSADSADGDAVTNETGFATFQLSPEEVSTIGFEASVGDADLESAVETVGLRSEPSMIGAGEETTVEATVRHSDTSADLSGTTVTAEPAGWVAGDGSDETGEDGTATFDVTPTNEEENETMAFQATVEGHDLTTDVESVVPVFDARPERIYVGKVSDVPVTLKAVEDGEMVGQDEEVTVETDAYDVDPASQTTDDGHATFTADLSDTTETGAITFSTSVGDAALSDSVGVAEPDVTVDHDELVVDETGTVTVTVTGESSDGIADYEVQVLGDLQEGDRSASTDDAGEVEFEITPASDDPVEVRIASLDYEETIQVEDPSDGGNQTPGDGDQDPGGIGGGGGGGGASPETYADVNVTDVSLSANEIRQGETLDVTVTLVNEGSADGTYEVRVKAGVFTVASETVDVPSGETRTVTVPVTFANPGERKISVDGVGAGKVTVEELEPENVPDGTEAADAQPVVDVDEATDGTVVEFDENVTVDAIVFPNASNGTVTVADLEALPEDVPATPGPVIRAMDIEVPADLENESATIRLTLDATAVEDREAVRLGRFHDGEWQTLEAESVEASGGELVYEFETPGFSTFAVFAQETEDPQVTATPQDTDDQTSTATDDDGAAEEAGFGTFGTVAIAFIALIAVLLAVAGARMYQQNRL